MLFRNAHIKQPIRKTVLKVQKSRSCRHCGRNGTNAVVLPGKPAKRSAEGIRKGHCIFFGAHTGFGIKAPHSMKLGGCLLSRCIAPALLGNHMHHNRASHCLGIIQNAYESRQVMAVNRAKIPKTHILKNRSGKQNSAQPILSFAGHTIDPFTAGDVG